MKTNLLLIFFILTPLFVACNRSPKQAARSASREEKQVALSYASLFSIAHADNYVAVTVMNPWKAKEVYARYYLVKDATIQVPEDGKKVHIPLKSLMINSTTHVGFLDMLNELDKVTGVCSAELIYQPDLRRRIAEGQVANLGDAFNLNIEKLLLLHPDAVMTTAYNADDANSRLMRQTGLPLLYNVEWQEATVLGRAEWIKYVAAFFDKEALADSLFRDVEQRYLAIRDQVIGSEQRPAVLSGQDFRGSWSMPGGRSFSAELLRDAGATYFYADNTTRGSVQVTIEEALLRFGKADVWIGAQVETLEELGKMNEKYKLFKAYKSHQVYNYNRRVTSTGGNDYWESGIARPDLLLSDLIKVLHPELLPDYALTYMRQLE